MEPDTRTACVVCTECRGSPACQEAVKPTPKPTTIPPTAPRPTPAPPTPASSWVGYNSQPCSEYAADKPYHAYCSDTGTGTDKRSACVACAKECRGSDACPSASVSTVTVATVSVTPAVDDPNCVNEPQFEDNCDAWAASGECTNSKDFMQQYCCRTCKTSQQRAFTYAGIPSDCVVASTQIVNGVSVVTCASGQQYAADQNDYYWMMDPASSTLRRSASGFAAPAPAPRVAELRSYSREAAGLSQNNANPWWQQGFPHSPPALTWATVQNNQAFHSSRPPFP